MGMNISPDQHLFPLKGKPIPADMLCRDAPGDQGCFILLFFDLCESRLYGVLQEVSQELLEELLVKQMEGARQSAEYVKKLCREYSQL